MQANFKAQFIDSNWARYLSRLRDKLHYKRCLEMNYESVD